MLITLRTCLISAALGCVAIATASTGCGGGNSDLFTDSDASTTTTGSGGSGGGSTDDGGVITGNTPCASDKDCTPKGQLCDTARSVCVDCLSAQDCKTNEECKGGMCAAFTPCTSSKQCGNDQVCDVEGKRCVECVANADCKDGQACVDHACRSACTSDKDCTPKGQLCDTTQMVCVECVATADCDAKKYCVNHACIDRVCTPGSSVCKGGGVATCNAEGSAYGAASTCPPASPCTEAAGKATCSGQDAGMSTCDGITVWFLVSRSGAMFSTKFADTTTHWTALLQAFSADGPLKDYASKMKIGLSTFAGESVAPACPDLVTFAPASGTAAAILKALTDAQKPTKGETPTTAAYTAVATMLQADTAGAKYIVILGDAAPDRCADPSTYCAQDELLQAVQSAYSAGIQTKIIGLPNAFLSQGLWNQFLQDVANAGAGKGVAYTATVTDEYLCNHIFKARYANEGGAPGTTAYSAPASPAEVTTAVGTTLGSLGCP